MKWNNFFFRIEYNKHKKNDISKDIPKYKMGRVITCKYNWNAYNYYELKHYNTILEKYYETK